MNILFKNFFFKKSLFRKINKKVNIHNVCSDFADAFIRREKQILKNVDFENVEEFQHISTKEILFEKLQNTKKHWKKCFFQIFSKKVFENQNFLFKKDFQFNCEQIFVFLMKFLRKDFQNVKENFFKIWKNK